MIPLIVNSKKVNVPTKWEEVKYLDFKKHLECKDGFDLVALYLGLSSEQLKQCSDVEGFHIANNALSFIAKDPLPPVKDKFVVSIKDEVILFPVDLLQKSVIGQYQDMYQSASSVTKETSNKEYFDICFELVCIYLQPILQKSEYDYYKIEEIKKDVEQLTAQEIYSMGSFFLTDLQRLQSGIGRIQRKLDTRKHRFYLSLKRWMNTAF